MTVPGNVADFLNRKAWHLAEYVDLGTTAHIFVVEKGSQRYALKMRRDEASDASALRVEHQVLQYLNTTAMQPYVPGVGEWLPELDGFLMEYLRYPAQVERDAQAWKPNLAQALRTLHSVSLPAIQGLADDRTEIGLAVSHRFRSMFQVVQKEDGFWAHLSGEDKANLEQVRTHYQTCIGLLGQIEAALAHVKPALTHGDLAGDNIMVTQDGRLAITDWGSTRISPAWIDVAHLLTYTNWPEDEEHQFLRIYFGDDLASLEEALPCLQVLSRLYRYHSCVQSLLWLNDEEDEGLDAVGRAHFKRMLRAL